MTPEQEVRSASICCPSCGGNLADLMRTGHRLALVLTEDVRRAECRDGQPAGLDDFGKLQAACNLALAEGWLWDVDADRTPLAGRSPLSMDFRAP